METEGAAAPLDHGWIRHGRARLNLAMRLSSRSHAVLSVGGAARGPWRGAAAVASAAADLAVARHLARSDRPELGRHWAVDAVDLAGWTALATEPGPAQLNTAMNSGHPLAIEAGARHGWLGLAVPLVNCLVAGVVNKRRGMSHPAGAFAWQAAAAVGGMGLARYARGLRSRRLRGHERQLGAELDRAELAAANELALGLDNIVDEVQRAAVLIRLGASVPAETGGEWKAELAEQTRRSHRYLVDVLVGWQHRHNQTSDLTEIVDLRIAPVLAPVVVSGTAGAALEARLDGLGLRGQVPVDLADDGSVVDPVTVETIGLRIGAQRLDLDTGLEPIRLTFDPVPGGFAWMALWLAAAAPQDNVPMRASVVPAAGALGLMLWAHRTSGRPPRAAQVLASTALAVAGSVASTKTLPSAHHPSGIPRVPASLALRGHAFVTALARRDLSPPVVAVATAGGLAAVVASWALTPRPRPVREFAAEMAWVAMSATMARAFTEGIERDSADLQAWVASIDEHRRAESAAVGRRRALAAVEAAREEAERLYAGYADQLEPDLRAEARRRLDACAERLESETSLGFAPCS